MASKTFDPNDIFLGKLLEAWREATDPTKKTKAAKAIAKYIGEQYPMPDFNPNGILRSHTKGLTTEEILAFKKNLDPQATIAGSQKILPTNETTIQPATV